MVRKAPQKFLKRSVRNMKSLLVLTIFALVLTTAPPSRADDASCVHYWLDGSRLVPSGKVVGVDVGDSPYGDVGEYRCSLRVERSDLSVAPYLFLGEIGDASYFELIKINGVLEKTIPFTHGLDPTLPGDLHEIPPVRNSPSIVLSRARPV